MHQVNANALPDVFHRGESTHTIPSVGGESRSAGMLLKVPDAAESLAVGRSTIYNLIADGELETVHIGRSVRVVTASLEAFVERHRDSFT